MTPLNSAHRKVALTPGPRSRLVTAGPGSGKTAVLNPAQNKAVLTPGPCLITACPGSGKTTVLKYRATRILKQPKNVVLGVTFTSAAAQDLEAKIRQQAAEDEIPNADVRVRCGTFHALCMRQLKEAGQQFRIIDEFRQNELVRRAFAETSELGEGIDLESCRTFIDTMKTQVDPSSPSPELEPRILVYEKYQELLRRMGAYDFADLIRLAVRGMRAPPGMEGHVDPVKCGEVMCTHMLVDEFQDTDDIQLEWIKEHVQHDVEVTVVGDDDQSIYAWRGAGGYDFMEKFSLRTQATHIPLNLTYRFPPEIMAVAAKLIQQNRERVPKTLATANGGEGTIRVVPCQTAADQAEKIWHAVLQSGEPGSWAVLARTNALLEQIEATAARAGVKVVREGGASFWDMDAPAMFLRLAEAIAERDVAKLDIVLKAAGMGDNDLHTMHARCRSTQPGALERFVGDTQATHAAEKQLRGYVKKWTPLVKSRPADVLGAMAYYLDKAVTISTDSGVRSDAAAKRDKQRFHSAARAMQGLQGTLAQRLHYLKDQHGKDVTGKVRLMTMHASKGLEFKHVWIAGCEDGVIPSAKGVLEEERRLFYVAVTRTSEDLTCSFVVGDKEHPYQPSPFLQEGGFFTAANVPA